MIHCTLDVNEYNKMLACSSAKKVWDKLEVTYEGTSQVKESKIDIFLRDYELFCMQPDKLWLNWITVLQIL